MRRFLRIAFRLYAGLLTLSFDAVAPVWADPGSNTPPHHELLLVLSPEDARLQAVDTLRLPPEDRFHPELSLSLSPNARVFSVSSGGEELPFSHRNGVLSVNTGTAPFGAASVVRIAYEGTFRDRPPEDPVNTELYFGFPGGMGFGRGGLGESEAGESDRTRDLEAPPDRRQYIPQCDPDLESRRRLDTATHETSLGVSIGSAIRYSRRIPSSNLPIGTARIFSPRENECSPA